MSFARQKRILLGVLALKSRRPEVYQAIGRTVLEETHEREPV